MPDTLLLVEDDPFLAESLIRLLGNQGYTVKWCPTAADGYTSLEQKPFRMMILDLGLPDEDGLSLCRRVRLRWNLPILMLTSRGESIDKVIGLEGGADDYMTKPFDAHELVARIRAQIRRSKEYPTETKVDASRSFGPLTLNTDERVIRVHDTALDLTETEYKIMEYLLINAGRAISREQLFEHVWGFEIEFSSNSLEVLVYRLRGKLEKAGSPPLIQTLRGYGYKLGNAS
ncbi:MAG: response regulator transcription factor [Fimbriimonas sp.]